MNQQQKTYALAKAHYETVCAMTAEDEEKYCREHGYLTAFGQTAKRLYQYACDKETFDRVCEDFEQSSLNHYAEKQEAARLLNQAEEALIDFSLSIIPAHLRETLEQARNNPKIRRKMLDTAFRLDVSTIPVLHPAPGADACGRVSGGDSESLRPQSRFTRRCLRPAPGADACGRVSGGDSESLRPQSRFTRRCTRERE